MSPNAPRDDNPARAIRVEDELWQRVKALAAERGESTSETVREALRRFVDSIHRKVDP